MERKLAAILSADVSGYSRLVEDDDEATIRALHDHRANMRTAIEDMHGRVVDSPGDNLLAEFPSAVDAVRCAVKMQQALNSTNSQAAPNRRMDFRMGINVGDVVVEDRKLYGNGVNIAARLEGLAEPGGICLSGNVHEQVTGKLDLDMRYGGERIVKNITSPIPVWHITVGDHDGRADAATSGSVAIPSPTRRPIIRIIAGVTLLLAVAALISAIWYYDSKPNSKTNRVPGLGVTDERPAVIVLPFVNLSDDSRQDYFVNGFVEDITTDLAKLGGLYVVSSNAAARYKGEKVDFGDLRERFGVSHAVEGSIRKAQDQVRISVRLVEVIGGKHVWGERYDIGVQGIFRVQDKVRGKILTALRVNLSRLEKQRFAKAPTINLEAYDYYLRGQEATRQARLLGEPDLMDDAIALFEQAVAIDPNYAAAYAAIGISRYIQWFYYGMEAEDGDGIARSAAYYEKAAVLAPDDPRIKSLLIRTKAFQGDYDTATELADELVSDFPKSADLAFDAGNVLIAAGQYTRGAELLERAALYFPKRPPYSYAIQGIAYHIVGRSEEGRDLLREATLRSPQFLGNHIMLTIIYDELGDRESAAAQAKHILRINPEFRAQSIVRVLPLKDKLILDTYISALRRAGVP